MRVFLLGLAQFKILHNGGNQKFTKKNQIQIEHQYKNENLYGIADAYCEERSHCLTSLFIALMRRRQ